MSNLLMLIFDNLILFLNNFCEQYKENRISIPTTFHQNYIYILYRIFIYSASFPISEALLLLLPLLFCVSLEYSARLFTFRHNIYKYLYLPRCFSCQLFHLGSYLFYLNYTFRISFTEGLLVVSLIFVYVYFASVPERNVYWILLGQISRLTIFCVRVYVCVCVLLSTIRYPSTVFSV